MDRAAILVKLKFYGRYKHYIINYTNNDIILVEAGTVEEQLGVP